MNRGGKNKGRGVYATSAWAPSARTITTTQTESANADSPRRQLEALFGNSSPSVVNTVSHEVVRPSGMSAPRRSFGRPPSQRTMKLTLMLQAMSEATANDDADAFRRAVDPFLKDHELPDDPETLRRMLYHPDNKVLCRVMGHISGLVLQRRMSGTPVLLSTLVDVSRRSNLDVDTKSCVDGLRQQIEKLRQA